MEYVMLVIGVILGFLIYRQGIKDGQQVKREQVLKPIVKSPVKVLAEVKEHKESDRVSDGIANLMAFDGNKQEEVK